MMFNLLHHCISSGHVEGQGLLSPACFGRGKRCEESSSAQGRASNPFQATNYISVILSRKILSILPGPWL